MFDKERELVEIGPHYYNLKVGGEGGFEYANQCITAEKRKEISRKGGQTFHISLEEHGRRISQSLVNNPNRFNAQKTLKSKYPNGTFNGHSHSEQTKKIMSEKASIRQKGSGNNQYGTMWITDGTANRKIKKEEVITKGWRRGRVIKRFHQIENWC